MQPHGITTPVKCVNCKKPIDLDHIYWWPRPYTKIASDGQSYVVQPNSAKPGYRCPHCKYKNSAYKRYERSTVEFVVKQRKEALAEIEMYDRQLQERGLLAIRKENGAIAKTPDYTSPLKRLIQDGLRTIKNKGDNKELRRWMRTNMPGGWTQEDKARLRKPGLMRSYISEVRHDLKIRASN